MKIIWNKVTWYSKLLALAMLVIFPVIGFFLGIQYQKSKTPLQNQITNPTQNQITPSQTKSPQPTPVVLNPKPGALNVKDIFAAPWKYTDQKVKISARIDIHTGNTSIMCTPGTNPCQQYKGTIYLKDINAAAGNTSNEIELAEKTRTDPSTYIELSCSGTASPIQDCLGYDNGNLTEIEGTLVRFPADQINQYTYMLII